MKGCGLEADLEGRPGPHVLALQCDPANGAVALGPSLDADRRRDCLILRPLEGMHGLALLQNSDHGGVRAGKHLVQGDILLDSVVLGTGLSIHGPGVALDSDPTLCLIFHRLALDAGDTSNLVIHWALQDGEDLALVQFPHDVAVFDILLIRHRHGSDAGVVLAVGFCQDVAFAVGCSEPANDVVRDSLAPNTLCGGENLLARALQQLQDLILLQRANGVAILNAEFRMKDNLLVARIVGLLHLLQEWCALVP
mmetsp:Transcript_51478/g.115802  ORF Transcript_51478/g.115802 Transcript_51478/m.115802 type:complete len:253 (+) Transcript_51478:215-973(+)